MSPLAGGLSRPSGRFFIVIASDSVAIYLLITFCHHFARPKWWRQKDAQSQITTQKAKPALLGLYWLNSAVSPCRQPQTAAAPNGSFATG